jgi:hypothetical protein
MYPRSLPALISVYQSGNRFKVSLLKPSLEALNRLTIHRQAMQESLDASARLSSEPPALLQPPPPPPPPPFHHPNHLPLPLPRMSVEAIRAAALAAGIPLADSPLSLPWSPGKRGGGKASDKPSRGGALRQVLLNFQGTQLDFKEPY